MGMLEDLEYRIVALETHVRALDNYAGKPQDYGGILDAVTSVCKECGGIGRIVVFRNGSYICRRCSKGCRTDDTKIIKED